MYFTLRSIPELRDLPEADRRRAWDEAMQDDARWLRIARLVLIAVAVAYTTKVILPFVTMWLPLPILAVALWIIFDRLSFMMWAVRLRPHIRQRLCRD
jgi:hypothetical protein